MKEAIKGGVDVGGERAINVAHLRIQPLAVEKPQGNVQFPPAVN